jgi:anti-sigma regulatory factor (Ser/Thr protein kinase)
MEKKINIKSLILTHLKKNRVIFLSEIVQATGFSRAYIHRFFQELRKENKIDLVGKANQAKYVLVTKRSLHLIQRKVKSVHRILRNNGLMEDKVLEEVKRKSGVFHNLPSNVSHILDYAVSEILNNAIEHSQSPLIRLRMKRNGVIYFSIIDEGIGIFRHIMKHKKLKSELEAIQDLLKGKQTTDPERHSGEGIFFTSKIADTFVIKSSTKKLTYDNLHNEIFIEEGKKILGTRVEFWINKKTKNDLEKIFQQFTGEEFEFGKSVVKVELYKTDVNYISRSQARRLTSGLDKFKEVILDFKNVETIGQGFADEVFRVWQKFHPSVKIIINNENENIQFMINHVTKS